MDGTTAVMGGSLVTIGDLAGLARWVAWRIEQRGESVTKVPLTVTGVPARSDNPADWATRPAAEQARCDGVGIMLADLQDGTELCGVDFDGCRYSDGTIAEWATRVVDLLGTYTEVSPSGEGLKAYFRLTQGDRSKLCTFLDGWGASWPQKLNGHAVSKAPKLEVHAGHRYYTVTDQIIDTAPENIRLLTWEELEPILLSLGPRPSKGTPAGAVAGIPEPVDETALAARLSEIMAKAPDDPLLRYLLRGDRLNDKLKDGKPDRSAHVMRIMGEAFRHGISFSETCSLISKCEFTTSWYADKGTRNNFRELRRHWEALRAPSENILEADDSPPPQPKHPQATPSGAKLKGNRNPGPMAPGIQGSALSDFTIADHIAYVGDKRHIDGGLQYVVAHDTIEDQWLMWLGRGWVHDPRAVQTRKLIKDALHFYVDRYGAEWKESHKTQALSRSKQENVQRILTDSLAVRKETCTPATYMLQTPDGMYDLRTLRLLEPKDVHQFYEVRYTGCSPQFDMPTPNFDKLLKGLAENNQEIVDWIWAYIGYCLLGNPRADFFVVLWGPGGNGKSKLVEVLEAMFKDYFTTLNRKVLLESGENLHATYLMQLRGKRLAVASELKDRDHWNETLLKGITGGDTITANSMRQDPISFKSEAGLFMVTNELPTFSKVSPAILRRFRLIGTMNQPEVPDTALAEKIIRDELPAVLGKAMRAAQTIYNPAGGVDDHIIMPNVPAAILAETREYMAENDKFYAWAATECDIGAHVGDHYEDIEMLKSRCDAFMAKAGGGMVGDGMSDRAFKKALRRLGCSVSDQNGLPLRRSLYVNGASRKVAVAKGIRLKVKAAA